MPFWLPEQVSPALIIAFALLYISIVVGLRLRGYGICFVFGSPLSNARALGV
jgi:hypothetical protein